MDLRTEVTGRTPFCLSRWCHVYCITVLYLYKTFWLANSRPAIRPQCPSIFCTYPQTPATSGPGLLLEAMFCNFCFPINKNDSLVLGQLAFGTEVPSGELMFDVGSVHIINYLKHWAVISLECVWEGTGNCSFHSSRSEIYFAWPDAGLAHLYLGAIPLFCRGDMARSRDISLGRYQHPGSRMEWILDELCVERPQSIGYGGSPSRAGGML